MEKIFVYLTNLSSNSAYAIIFGILLACGLGFPLPEDIPLIATGYLVWDMTFEFIPGFLVTMAGVLVGDSMLYFLGRKFGFAILQKPRFQNIFRPEKIRRTRAYFRKYGEKIVFFARFVAGFRAIAFFMSGAMKMKYRRFIILDGLAAMVSVPVWIGIGYGLGYYLGDEISQILHSMKNLKTAFTIIVFSIVAFVLARTLWSMRKTKRRKMEIRKRLKSN